MASVVFIIRVPFKDVENSEAKKEEKNDQPNDADDQADETAENVEILTHINWAEVLENELRSLKVQGDSWTVTHDKKFHQVMFFIKSGERVEKILERLTFVGVGKRLTTSISIISTSVHIQPEENIPSQRISTNESTMHSVDETEPLLEEQLDSSKESLKDKFKKSIKSRLTVKQVVESVRLQGILTFDFVMFTILASIIAAVGLVEDNAVALVASMLVSPLMGPILGATFGTVIKNESLRNTGLKTELCGLILSVVVGFLFGLICGPIAMSGLYAKDIWPTQEMTSRGMLRGLWVGVLIALPSGAGVALSVLGGNAGSLVGVAISASLLPPAVNSGILFAYSIVTAIKPPELLEIADFNTTTLKCPPFKDNSYNPIYSCEMASEAAVMAIISLALTILNIICIFIAATIVLKIKEVAPMTSSSNATQTFWTKDIKIAREAYSTIKGDQAQDFLKEWRKVQDNTKEGPRDSVLEDEELLDIIEEVENAEEVQNVVRRAPRGPQDMHKTSRNLRRLVSRDDVDENIAQKQEMNLQHTLRNLQTHYTQQSKEKTSQPHVETIFSKLQEPSPKPKKSIREFHVVETENPHHTSVVRVQPPDESSNKYSVTTESGV